MKNLSGTEILPERFLVARREPLATEITRGLLSYLLAGHVRPGEKIPSERKLAEALGVGRSVVREAIRTLNVLGLVEIHQGDGTYLRSAESELLLRSLEWGLMLGKKRTRDLIEARCQIELVLAELAATRRDQADLETLESHLADMAAAVGDSERFVTADMAFHYRIAEAARNEALSQIMAGVRSLLKVWITRAISSVDSFDPPLAEHRAVLEAIRVANPILARDMMRDHLENAFKRLERSFEETTSPATST